MFGGLGRQPFGDQVRVTNSGAITIDGEGDFNWGVALRGYSDILFDNDGAISVRGENLAGGRANRGDGFDLVGVLVSGYSDLIFNNSAAITLDAVDAGPAGAAILLVERSLDSTLPGTRHSSYDAAADTNSRFAVNLTANVTANGADQFGLFGYIGLRDDGSITTARRNTDDFAGFQFTNNQASVVVDVASGVSLTGGSGIGSAIAIQGTGNLIVTNAGSIVGRGGGQSAAIHVSSSAQLNPYLQFSLAPQTFQPDRFVTLRDMVNTGIVRSDAGHGIWAELGAIVNLTNRGLILGGVASVRALQTSSILNDAGGTLDGRILLEGAGSSLVNNGIVQVSTPGAVTHQINGSFTQGAAATLALRGGDRMNVTGNFVLNGDLNLALGAPNLDPIITVGANLTLDGRLNVTDAGGFGDGVYRLFNYGGTLTDNGLALGALPGGANGNLQTAIAGQVNLVVGGAGPDLSIQFWDGADTAPDGTVDGGAGTWNRAPPNWTSADGSFNAPWAGNFAVFQNAGGTVTVEGAQGVTGMQFAGNGYRLAAGANGSILLNAAETPVRVDPSITAELALPLGGTGAIVKRDPGTLILSGVNTYSGGTLIREGVLQAAADNALGTGGVTLDGGTLRFAAAATSARSFTIGTGGGTIDAPNALTLSGAIGGSGALTKAGAGTLTLSGNTSAYTGTTNVTAGTLLVTGSLGGSLNVQSGGRLLGTGTLGNVTIASGGIACPGRLDRHAQRERQRHLQRRLLLRSGACGRRRHGPARRRRHRDDPGRHGSGHRARPGDSICRRPQLYLPHRGGRPHGHLRRPDRDLGLPRLRLGLYRQQRLRHRRRGPHLPRRRGDLQPEPGLDRARRVRPDGGLGQPRRLQPAPAARRRCGARRLRRLVRRNLSGAGRLRAAPRRRPRLALHRPQPCPFGRGLGPVGRRLRP